MPKLRSLGLQLLREAILVMAAYYVYVTAKNLVHTTPYAQAFQHAWDIVSLERVLGIFHEEKLQRWLLHEAKGVVMFFNWVYTLGFWPTILTTALIFFIKDRTTYHKYRSVMFVSFAMAVVIFALYPLAPPRMLGYLGFVDTIQVLGPLQYTSGSDLLSYNKYAAMPSMHFAWAFLISMAWASTRHLWAKMAAVVYQTLMMGAVVITGNHYFLDVILAIPVIMASYYIYQLTLSPPSRSTYKGTTKA